MTSELWIGSESNPDCHKKSASELYSTNSSFRSGTSKEYNDTLLKAQVEIRIAKVGESTQNAYTERLMRTTKEEEVNLTEYKDFQDCYQNIGRFLNDV